MVDITKLSLLLNKLFLIIPSYVVDESVAFSGLLEEAQSQGRINILIFGVLSSNPGSI